MFFLQNFRREIGNSLISLGERLDGKREVQPAASSSMPDSNSNMHTLSSQSAPIPGSGNSANKRLGQSDTAPDTQTTQRTMNSTDSRAADLPSFRKHFRNANAMTGRSVVARQLWSALGTADRAAELPLAELYLAGDGVPRSCEHARVLLKAAAMNGDIEAQQWLKRVNKHRCR